MEKVKRLKLRAARVTYATRAPCKRASRSHAKTGCFFDDFSCFLDAFLHLFSYDNPVDLLLVFLRIFLMILIALILENEHGVQARRSFS